MPSTAHAQLVPILRWLFGSQLLDDDALARQARAMLLDTIGCALAGLDAPVLHAQQQLLAEDGGVLRFPGHASGVTAASATELLATAAVWDEACEGLARAHGRPGVGVIAACLPLAVLQNRSLGDLLTAILTGYEVGARMGEWLRIRPGMHVDAGWPALGVAAAATRLQRRSADEALAAIEIAACQVPLGLYSPVRAGANARNTYLAHASALGLHAARAVASGMDAPPDALSEYARIALGIDPASAKLAPAGEFLIAESYLKPFAAVRHVHYGASAAMQLRDRLFARLAAIESIELAIYQEAITYCGNRSPQTPIAAQFSLSFGVASALRFGDLGPGAYRDDRFREAGLRRLEQLVEVTPDLDRTARNVRGATLTVRLPGETLRVDVEQVKGDRHDPLDDAAVRAKFFDYLPARIDRAAASKFADALLTSAADRPFAELWTALGSQ